MNGFFIIIYLGAPGTPPPRNLVRKLTTTSNGLNPYNIHEYFEMMAMKYSHQGGAPPSSFGGLIPSGPPSSPPPLGSGGSGNFFNGNGMRMMQPPPMMQYPSPFYYYGNFWTYLTTVLLLETLNKILNYYFSNLDRQKSMELTFMD